MKRKVQAGLMGRWMQSKSRLIRECNYGSQQFGTKKTWKVVACEAPMVGWVVGFRTLYDVSVSYAYDEGPSCVRTGKTHRVALLATDPDVRGTPVPVEALEETSATWNTREQKQWNAVKRSTHWKALREEMRREARSQPRTADGKFRAANAPG